MISVKHSMGPYKKVEISEAFALKLAKWGKSSNRKQQQANKSILNFCRLISHSSQAYQTKVFSIAANPTPHYHFFCYLDYLIFFQEETIPTGEKCLILVQFEEKP